MENFLGKDGFVWWYGVVEDRNDPLQLGRCKVRVFGWHTDNLQELPTQSLPWATVMYSPNSSQSFSTPREGDYVSGFFSDVHSGQVPVVMGVLPGLEANYDRSKGFSPQGKSFKPKPPSGQVQYTPGQPTIAPLGRGIIANTSISVANSNLAHVCDVSSSIKYQIAKLQIFVSGIIQKIRKALSELWKGSSSSPFAEEIRTKIETIKGKIKEIQKWIRENIEPLKRIKEFIEFIQNLIIFITTLPAQLAKLLKECLSEALASASSAISAGKSLLIQSNYNIGDAQNILSVAQDSLDKSNTATVPSTNSSMSKP